jgi:DNA-binding beta-propeller fold protein YncE
LPVQLIGALATVGAVLLLIPVSASADYVFLETFGSTAQPSFTKAEGMAVDQSNGDLLVIDAGSGPGTGTLSRFHEDGSPSNFSSLATNVIGGLTFGVAGEVQVAVDNSGGATDGNIYLTQAGAHLIKVFGSDGALLEQLTGYEEGPAAEGPAALFGEVCGVAVDPAGNLYVGEYGVSTGQVHKYEPAGAFPKNEDNTANFPFKESCTLAAGAEATAGAIFPAHFLEEVAKLDASTGAKAYEFGSATTTVTVNPENGHLFTAAGAEVKEWDASGPSEAEELEHFSPGGSVTGIAVDEASGNVYVARSGSAGIEVWGSAALPEATTEAASVVNGLVTLRGTVSAAEGPPASCFFEYVEVKANGFEGASTKPCSPSGPFTALDPPTAVSAEISGLPEAAFRFRLVAENEDGSILGETLFFDTFAQIAGLPDGRSYEMVSPAQKTGEVIPPEPGSNLGGSCIECLPGQNKRAMPMQTAPDGEAVAYEGQPFSGGLAAGPNEYISERSASGWGTDSLSSPLFSSNSGQGYWAFSKDLSRSVVFQIEPTLSPEAPVRGERGYPNLYLREEEGTLQPLVTEEPPNRGPGLFQILFAGANAGGTLSPAFEHLIFEANDALTGVVPGIAPQAPEADGECTFGSASCNLYEWSGGELALVNVLPGNGAAAQNAVLGSGRLLIEGNSQLQAPDVDHAISDDGSRIFWSEEKSGQVYVRVDGVKTLEIPGPESCKKSTPLSQRACFLTASADGSAVLLSDGQIYELNGTGEAYEAGPDLSEGPGDFKGILGTSEDLSQIYFIDTEALTESGEENANDEHAEAGELNLYGWSEGEVAFIGRLLAGDNGFGLEGRFGAWKTSRPNRTAQVSPDGGLLAFMSRAPLSPGYDNTVSGGGECREGLAACFEVFVYEADSETLSCASCNPSGEQPLGNSNLSLIKPVGPPFPQPGNLSHAGNGRVFFESQDVLSPQDTNGNIQDVYEWEPQGIGSCGRAEGCVYLISSGHSPNDSKFVDSTPSGNDAFIITREQLLPRDKDQQLDLYDARVGGGFEEAITAPCGGDACKGPITPPPPQPGAPSATFSGPGNPQPAKPSCKRGFVRKHGKCVKRKPKKQKRRGGSK